MKEAISLHIGQAGIQLADYVWELFSLQHNIHPNQQENQASIHQGTHAYFSEDGEKKFRPRAVHIDLDSNAIDHTRKGHQRDLFDSENFVVGKGGGGSNFARGHGSVGKEVIDLCLERVRKQAEKCANLEGFLLFNSLGGGTGAGLGSLMLERLSEDFSGKVKVGFNIFPDAHTSSAFVQPYNTVLACHSILKHQDVSIVLDNLALYKIGRRVLDCDFPSFSTFNNVTAHIVSSVTAPHRLDGPLNYTYNEFQQSLIPFPRFQFLISTYAPLMHQEKACGYLDVNELTQLTFEPFILMVNCDPRHGMYMASRVHYRGDVSARDINTAISNLKTKKNIKFADWCPKYFKISLHYDSPKVLINGDIRREMRNCSMISNNTAIGSFFERFNCQFSLMHQKRAFMHWYILQGMEETEFGEALQDLTTLVDEYEQAEASTEEEPKP